MIITILYAVWISYTATSLSVILGLISLSYLGRKEQKKNDERIRKLLGARPEDDEN